MLIWTLIERHTVFIILRNLNSASFKNATDCVAKTLPKLRDAVIFKANYIEKRSLVMYYLLFILIINVL